MFRSKYTQPETPTFVELTFRYRDRDYTVRRNPDYDRPKARGTGVTRQKADGEFHRPDGSVVTGASDVTREVESLLGLNCGQFTQVAMIAQGDFSPQAAMALATSFRPLPVTTETTVASGAIFPCAQSFFSFDFLPGGFRVVDLYLEKFHVLVKGRQLDILDPESPPGPGKPKVFWDFCHYLGLSWPRKEHWLIRIARKMDGIQKQIGSTIPSAVSAQIFVDVGRAVDSNQLHPKLQNIL